MKTTTWLSKRLAIISQFWLVKSGNRFNMSTPSHKGFFSFAPKTAVRHRYASNPEPTKAAAVQRYASNPEPAKAAVKRKYAENPELMKGTSRSRHVMNLKLAMAASIKQVRSKMGIIADPL